MIYEVYGPVHNGQTVREVRRLKYRSATDWTDTVIELIRDNEPELRADIHGDYIVWLDCRVN